MPYQLSWYMPGHVVLLTLTGSITAADVQLLSDQIYEMMESDEGTDLVCTLVDGRACTLGDKIWVYGKLKFPIHQRRGRTVVIGEASMLGLVVSLLARATNFHVNFTSTFEAAIKMLVTWDAKVASYVAQQEKNTLD